MVKKQEPTTSEIKKVRAKKDETEKNDLYIYAVGRRKSASATVRLYVKGSGNILVNNKKIEEYFPLPALQELIKSPLKTAGIKNVHDFTVKVVGGGIKGQAESIRLGISKTLIKLDETLRKALKAQGFLSRDPRVKERKKPGLRRARRAPQWSKR